MAIRFDAAADRLLRTANLPNYNAPYSWMAWMYLVSDQNDYGIMFSLDRNDGGANYDITGVGSDGTSFFCEVSDQSGNLTSIDSGVDFVVGAWAHIALVRYSPTDLRMFFNGQQVGASNTRSVSGRSSAATRMEMGGGWTTDNYYLADCRSAAIKIYDDALMQPEINLEMLYNVPQRRAGLHLWTPARYGADRHYDFSGNGRDWTATGLADEADPPILWDVPGMLPFWMLDAGSSSAIALTIQDAASASTMDSVTLTQHHVLAVDDGASVTTLDNATLTQAHVLIAQDAESQTTLDSVTLTQAHVLIVVDAASVTTLDNVTIVITGALVVQDGTSLQTIDGVTLAQHHVLAVSDAASVTTLDNATLTTTPAPVAGNGELIKASSRIAIDASDRAEVVASGRIDIDAGTRITIRASERIVIR